MAHATTMNSPQGSNDVNERNCCYGLPEAPEVMPGEIAGKIQHAVRH